MAENFTDFYNYSETPVSSHCTGQRCNTGMELMLAVTENSSQRTDMNNCNGNDQIHSKSLESRYMLDLQGLDSDENDFLDTL